MAILNVPIKSGAASWTQRMTLDGVAYILDFAWNGREGAWYLGVLDIGGNPLVLGRKLVTNRPILRAFRFVAGLPAGDFVAADLSASIPYAGFDDLGKSVKLLYFEASELA